MSDPHARLASSSKERLHMFIYLVNLTNGKTVRVVTEGDPTEHPSFFNRVESVETIGEEGKLLSLV
tara:strand:+ start:65 stop:262 length:198 start_codon:yes stop_codon:yes gene_type:complete